MGFTGKKILVPVALSESAKLDELASPAVGCALDIAAAFSGSVHVVTVPPSLADAVAHTTGTSATDTRSPKASDVWLRGAGESLDALVALAAERGIEGTRRILGTGETAEVIVKEAEAVGADVIVVPSHGRRGVRRLVFGSVAEALAKLASVPVVLLPPERH